MTSAPPPAPPSSGSPPPMEPPAWAPPPPPSEPAPRPPLRRSTGDKMIGGVCGGLAEYTGVDALLWRVGFVALTVAGGTGVVVYALLWLLMPTDPTGSATAAPAVPRRAAGRAPAGPRSPVQRITLAGLLIVIGVLVLLTRLTSWSLGPRGFLGAALLVVGAGLVVSAFMPGRRSRGGLILLGVLLSIALAVASVPGQNWHWNVHGGVGNREYQPQTPADVQPVYDAAIGNTTVDLSEVALTGAGTPIHTRVDGGVGNLRVLLPASADVQVSVQDGLGHVDVLGHGSSGGLYPGSGPASWSGDDHPEFVLTIDAGIGNVEVSRA